ncbi:DUF423 domain-containing protein [Kushneria aurantia]|uniref:DUF423 domain-containing protein n=1 Tax=Kushneria aurantia TaxID=504092 RepID=A0ABV6G222_9GAMM|nr:DUF423 domain-containing protein [Kushneria aurantia]
MTQRHGWLLVALSGITLVIMGALGAHALADRLDPERLNGWHTAVRYQAWHTLAAMVVLVWRERTPLPGQRAVLWLWGLGTLAFCGSIYALSLGAPALFGPVTPLGGLALIAGWAALAVMALRRPGAQ